MPTLKTLYYKNDERICLTCMYIDEYAFNVREDGQVPFGYDGMAYCDNCPNPREAIISPLKCACSRWTKCTEGQSKYLEIYDVKSGAVIPNPNEISRIS